MVVIFSSHSNNSSQVKREIERAANRAIPIVPFRIEDVSPTEAMEYFISSHHWMDGLTAPLERHLNELGETMARILLKGSAATPAPQVRTEPSPLPLQPAPPTPQVRQPPSNRKTAQINSSDAELTKLRDDGVSNLERLLSDEMAFQRWRARVEAKLNRMTQPGDVFRAVFACILGGRVKSAHVCGTLGFLEGLMLGNFKGVKPMQVVRQLIEEVEMNEEITSDINAFERWRYKCALFLGMAFDKEPGRKLSWDTNDAHGLTLKARAGVALGILEGFVDGTS